MRTLTLVCLATLGAGLSGAAAADAVYRCEGADGRVTYTNEPCPSTARKSRTVDDSPAVQAPREAASKAGNEAKEPAKEAAAGGDAAKPAEPAKSQVRVATTAAGLQPAGAPKLSPAQQMEQLDQERSRQAQRCAELDRSIAFARRDLEAALGGQRASAELQLRRLQEDHLVQCPQ